MKYLTINLIIALSIFISTTNAQTYVVSAEIISNGGGNATGGNYSNFSVLGETFVNQSVTGGNYNTFIGFLNLSSVSTGLSENFYNSNINIFPNPTRNTINIDVSNYSSAIKKIEFYSVLGKKILECQFQNNINISDFPDGIYLLKIIDNYGKVVLSEKIIKK